MAQRLTKRVVDAAEVGIKDHYIWDSSLKGFGLKVTPSGRKVYIVQYRLGGRKGRTRRVTLGQHGPLTTEEARGLAKKTLGQVSAGTDPAAELDKTRAGSLMTSLLDKFDEQHIEVKLKPKSQEDYRRNIRLYIKPALGHMLVHQVTRQDVARLHHSLREKPYVGNRVISVLSKFFNWCEKFGYREEGKNPSRYIDKYKEKKRQRFLSKIELPDSKTGEKSIYLNEAAKDTLAKIMRQVDNPYVICGAKPGEHIVNLQKSWRRIRSMADLDDVRLHDLRHTFASIAVSSGMSLPLIGALLGHSQPRTTARYAHLASGPLRDAVEKANWTSEIIQLTIFNRSKADIS